MATVALSTMKKENQTLRERLKRARAGGKEAGKQFAEVAVTGVSAFSAGFACKKFIPSGKLFNFLPAKPTIGIGLIIAGMMTDSRHIGNAGKGFLYAAAAQLGEDLASK